MIRRAIKISKSSSFFLFGARGTGKSTLLRKQLFQPVEALLIDLLLPREFDALLRRPESLLERIGALPSQGNSPRWVILDEVQKLPQLLDVVQYAIEELKIRFALSGSSARKLKRGGANLLAGRAFVYHLFPFTHIELGDAFDLETTLNFGSLPGVFEFAEARDKHEFLMAYAHSYLREEVMAEQVLRSLPPFRRFLEVAAQMSGELVNFASIARDVGVDDKTVKNYYSVLEDTLMGFYLQPYHRSVRKTQLISPRFYIFDLGVRRALAGTLSSRVVEGTYAWGKAFEHFVISECLRLNSYLRRDFRFSFLRTQAGAEVDLIVERPEATTLCVEIKSSREVSPQDLKHLDAIAADIPNSEKLLLSADAKPKRIGDTHCLPWRDGLKQMGLA